MAMTKSNLTPSVVITFVVVGCGHSSYPSQTAIHPKQQPEDSADASEAQEEKAPRLRAL